ncbi:hypothetical protein [Luteimonas abyssi]|uniref:hypothetical protein n=1 Tax=Luteimonas abyssi TaxID=1247514 RepID=UPI000B127FE5|nr:hypothetical protein [Luteimonas abyssi]
MKPLALVAALAFPLIAGLPAAAAELDCDAADGWAQRTICRTPGLQALETELQALIPDLALRSDDPDALAGEQAQWARERRDTCISVRCLDTSYSSRLDEIRRRIASGRPPLVMPGTYRQPAQADAPVLDVQRQGQGRYDLQITAAALDAPLEGGFEERVGSARFEHDACSFDLRFAPDLMSVANAAGTCPEGLTGDYLRVDD